MGAGQSQRGGGEALLWLMGAAIATVVLWQVPLGAFVLYPFSILATWFHEMGHGLMAMLLGGRFERLMLYANGSGLAFHSGGLWLGGAGRALVAAAGLVGPSLAGMLLLRLSVLRLPRVQLGLFGLGCLLLLSAALWVRTGFGVAMIVGLGVAIAAIPLYAPVWMQYFALQFLGVQACISSFHQLDYLFTERVVIGGQAMLSDTGRMAEQLLLPYWVWGLLLTALSLVLLGSGLLTVARSRD